MLNSRKPGLLEAGGMGSQAGSVVEDFPLLSAGFEHLYDQKNRQVWVHNTSFGVERFKSSPCWQSGIGLGRTAAQRCRLLRSHAPQPSAEWKAVGVQPTMFTSVLFRSLVRCRPGEAARRDPSLTKLSNAPHLCEGAHMILAVLP